MVEGGQTVDEIYTALTHRLSLTERLKLATLLLNDLAQPDVAVIDQATRWSAADQHEVAAFAWHYAATALPDENGEV